MLQFYTWVVLCVLAVVMNPAHAQSTLGPFSLINAEGGKLMVSKYRCQSDHHEVSVPGMIRDEALHGIGSGAFAGCSTLRSIDLPAGLIRIDSSAFWNCIALEQINLPDTLAFLGKMAFYGCEKLARILLPSSLTEIEGYALAGNYQLKAIEVAVGNPRFASLDGMLIDREGTLVQFPFGKTNIFMAPPQVVRIGPDAFADNARLLAVALPGHVKSIGPRAFANCGSLQILQIQQGLEEIGDEALAGCRALTKLVLPASLRKLGRMAFRDSQNLRELLFAGPPPEADNDAFKGLPPDVSIKVNADAGAWGDAFAGRPVIAVRASAP